MPVNINRTDRFARVVLGLALFLFGILLGTWWGLLGLIPIATALGGWCPLKFVSDAVTRSRADTPGVRDY